MRFARIGVVAVAGASATRIVVVLLAPTGRGVSCTSAAACLAFDEPGKEVTAPVLAVRVALVLSKCSYGALLGTRMVQYRSHLLLNDVLAAVCLDLVNARVSELANDPREGRSRSRPGTRPTLPTVVAPT